MVRRFYMKENESMSDLLIKGATIPQGCRQCHFKEWTNSRAGWFCPLRHKFLSMRVIIQDKRYNDCPLIEIPPHGDLIDRTALKTKLNNVHDFLLGDCKFSELATSDKTRIDELTNCMAEVVNAPTIIESEERDYE